MAASGHGCRLPGRRCRRPPHRERLGLATVHARGRRTSEHHLPMAGGDGNGWWARRFRPPHDRRAARGWTTERALHLHLVPRSMRHPPDRPATGGTIGAREQRPWGWTEWCAAEGDRLRAPYEFETVAVLEIVAICNARANREVGEWQHPATAADCRDAGPAEAAGNGAPECGLTYTIAAAGIGSRIPRGRRCKRTSLIRFDGGAAFYGGSDGELLQDSTTLAQPGQHTMEARELRPWGCRRTGSAL